MKIGLQIDLILSTKKLSTFLLSLYRITQYTKFVAWRTEFPKSSVSDSKWWVSRSRTGVGLGLCLGLGFSLGLVITFLQFAAFSKGKRQTRTRNTETLLFTSVLDPISESIFIDCADSFSVFVLKKAPF